MSAVQGRDMGSVADQLSRLADVRAVRDGDAAPREKERLDELLNLVKLKHHLLARGYASFHIKIAPNTYYAWQLGGPKQRSGARSCARTASTSCARR